MESADRLDHQREFERSWVDRRHSRAQRPPLDINRVLAERYRANRPIAFTRSMLWDVAVGKAWQPDRYTPSAVRAGSVATWGRRIADDGAETFCRASEQRLWPEPHAFGLVLEQVRLDPRQQKVTVIGARQLPTRCGRMLHADPRQPVFSVEDAIGGDETAPVNRSRIVHLTEEPDETLIDAGDRAPSRAPLPEFVEIYLQRTLGVALTRR